MEACGRGSEGPLSVRYHAGRFQNILRDVGPPESVVSAMIRGRDDAMLLATLARGAIAYRSGRFEAVATTKAMPSSSFVISIAEASDGNIWLGTRDAGLLRVQGERLSRYTDACRISRSTACCPGMLARCGSGPTVE